jgi:putative two-component system response regulator
MDQDEHFARLMRQASPLHDIGKIGLPDSLIRKQGPLNDEEWELVRRHPQTGAQMLNSSNVPVLRLAAEIALSHHEKFDGSGYPQGLSGSDIPLAGRIVALIDYFDALTNERPYRTAHSDAEALDMIVSESGRHFDPELIRAFLGARDELIAERDRINGGAMALDALVRQ